MNPISVLLSSARRPDDLDTLVLVGVIGTAIDAGRKPLIRGLSEPRFQKLLNEYFPGIVLTNDAANYSFSDADEFDDLLALLLQSRAEPSETAAWLAYATASASMGENHLWQDMGLPSRRHLSEFLNRYFPALAAKNTGDMKWKKFFYRQLCEQAGISICKSPHCAECVDYAICFGPEEGPAA